MQDETQKGSVSKMKCPKCKAEAEDGSNFCPQCGSDLKKSGNEGKKPGRQRKDEGDAPNEERAGANPDGPGGFANENEPETGTQEAKSSDPEGEGDKGVAGQPPKAPTSGQAGQAAAPQGKIGGGFLAAVIAVAALAAIGVGCGIVHTVLASAASSSSQESGSDLASGGSSAGSYGDGEEGSQSSSSGSSPSSTSSSSSSSPSSSGTSSSGSSQAASGQGETDAVSDLASAQNCSDAGGSATLQSSPSSQSAFTVSGTSAWGPILTCVAQQTSMPSSEETEIRSFVNQVASNSESGSSSASPQTVSWGLGDKSEIYATFAPAPGGQGGWSVGFADTPSASAADFQDLQSEDQGSDTASQGSDAVSALQNSAQQCSADAGESDLQSNPSGPDMLIVSGQNDWGSVLACVAQHTSMPAADQAKIKSFIDAVSSDPNSGQSGGTASWSMKDGSKIYTSYDPAASQPGAWIVDMGDEPSGGAN